MNSNGVLQPYQHLGWWKWMYRVSPYTYVIEAVIGQGEALLSFYSTYWGLC
jgi:ATP-binding cassette subfamily G (WHITE) protein 2 (SNQ2)